MASFDIATRTKAIFGEGMRAELGGLIGETAGSTTLVVASASALKRDMTQSIVATLQAQGPVVIWDKVQPNPRVSDIDACLEAHKDSGISHIVGIGGGSALDQAKATAMALDTGLTIAELLKLKPGLPVRRNTLILMPTTSGTGAELSYGAILTDTVSGEKLGLRGANQAADYAIVDPELTYSLPRSEAMITGFDVLTHALETFISTAATPYTTDLSRGAVERVFKHLPMLFDDGSNIEAHAELSYASMMMGINLALSTTCMPHRLQYPIGAETDTAHAAGLAAIYPAWLKHLLPHAEEKLAQCADWIGVGGKNQAESAHNFARATVALLERIELTPTLQELGVTKEAVGRFASEVSGKLETDPSFKARDDLAKIYQDAWSGAGL
jgi:alcohol dehydrogenase class IV